MVRERRPSATSADQPAPSSQRDRTPLANISAKMQSPSSRQIDTTTPIEAVKSSPVSDIEFGKASPLRNPLRRPATSVFIPKPKVVAKKPLPLDHPLRNASSQRTGTSGFYLPGAKPSSSQNATLATDRVSSQALDQMFDDEPDYTRIFKPRNAQLQDVRPPSKPKFSSMGAGDSSSSRPTNKPTIDLTQDDSADEDGDTSFDPDAIIRSQRDSFGAVDPYSYMDASQANENMRKLLEGAFDDGSEPSQTRLRRRARQAEQEEVEVKSLADKLAALGVNADKKASGDAKDEEEEPEDGTVEGLSVKLLPHQVEGVRWMIDKEIGRGKRGGVLPNGGILADDMGLGKTVQSITLILTNARPSPDAKPTDEKQRLPGKEVGKSTLVVAPLALIKQWEAEIKSKVARSHALRVLVHHGPNRTKSSLDLKKYDVVITTYQSLTSEHANSNMTSATGTKIGCMGVHWYRIMLDEAHSIKNRSAKAHQACCALKSHYRWCLTGTPLQNNLDELQALIKFLRIKPYCELSSWKDSIITPMKNGRGGLAMRRLQVFLQAMMKRRTKDILKKEGALNFGGQVDADGEPKKSGMQIVKREVQIVECEFDEVEQRFYDKLSERADAKLKDMMQGNKKTDYIGALVLLLRLRQACNHPHLITMAMNKDKDAMAMTDMNSAQQRDSGNVNDEMDDLASLMGGITVQNKTCDVCQVKLSAKEADKETSRCDECDEDLNMVEKSRSEKRAKKKTGKRSTDRKENRDASKQNQSDSRQAQAERRARNRKVIHDSDDEDEGEGEWIGQGPEQRIDLGHAGGTDDEDADGGGETLATIDSVRSDEDDADEDEDEDEDDEDEDDEDDESSDEDKNDSNSDDRDSDDSDSQASEASEDLASFHKSRDEGSKNQKFNVLRGMESSERSKSEPSTKIRQLLRILHREAPQFKTIVFSQFTSMLDLIEPHLAQASIKYVRYDGSMRPDEREKALDSLRSNARTRVLLCSLKCGSLGLNLTAASRVVIVEPFWNPFVEEQAIDRVHRLNQTVDVKVFRLTMRDSVEERIMELQERKRELAKYAIEGSSAAGKLSMEDILGLFRNDAVHAAHDAEDRELWEKFGSDARLLQKSGTDPSSPRKVLPQTNARKGGKESQHSQNLHRERDVYGRRW